MVLLLRSSTYRPTTSNGITASSAATPEALSSAPARQENRTLKQIERAAIEAALEQCDWVIEGARGAAVRLDLKPSTLRERMRKHGLKRPGA